MQRSTQERWLPSLDLEPSQNCSPRGALHLSGAVGFSQGRGIESEHLPLVPFDWQLLPSAQLPARGGADPLVLIAWPRQRQIPSHDQDPGHGLPLKTPRQLNRQWQKRGTGLTCAGASAQASQARWQPEHLGLRAGLPPAGSDLCVAPGCCAEAGQGGQPASLHCCSP